MGIPGMNSPRRPATYVRAGLDASAPALAWRRRASPSPHADGGWPAPAVYAHEGTGPAGSSYEAAGEGAAQLILQNGKPVANQTGVAVLQDSTWKARLYPDARIELNFTSPLELLVAAILSAQTTDRRVNEVTRVLFVRYRTAADYTAADRAELERLIRPTGFFRAKANQLITLGQALCDRFGGKVPDTLDELVNLPGVGRKTANLVLGDAFGKPSLNGGHPLCPAGAPVRLDSAKPTRGVRGST